jgi:hypothetical protein
MEVVDISGDGDAAPNPATRRCSAHRRRTCRREPHLDFGAQPHDPAQNHPKGIANNRSDFLPMIEARCCSGDHDAGEQLERHQWSKTANTLARRRRRGRRRTRTRPRAFLAKPDMGGGSTLLSPLSDLVYGDGSQHEAPRLIVRGGGHVHIPSRGG